MVEAQDALWQRMARRCANRVELLDPQTDAAEVRAIFVHLPDFAWLRALGGLILAHVTKQPPTPPVLAISKWAQR